jgi:phenylpropionate dioxygenase-like ring-hydroxylating dioxygenase large terminal subunit
MLTTKQKLLRRFWHATVPISALAKGPVPFRLMGEDIVLFMAEDGQPAALADRCCHRTAKLSKGYAEAGRIVCGYHGWTYDRAGALTRIPQLDPATPLPKHSVPAYHCAERYGYVWVALDDPLTPIIDIPEDRDPAFRRIHQFYERWDTAPLRLMENSFDNAHFTFVHKGTFGVSQPKPSKYEIEETEYGFRATTVVEVVNPEAAWPVTGCTTPTTTRTMDNHWYLPFCRRMDMLYPSGIRHIIVNAATPVEDGKLQLVQLLFRNDSEAACSTETLIAWDAAIVREDKEILECTDPDAVLDQSLRAEKHMPSDRPGLIMRRRLLELLHSHGEAEVTNARPPD